MNDKGTLSSIGKRIKKLRIMNNMTQSELAGDFMTRNMLSRIENSAALPSLNTLVCIAEKLNIPAGCLIEESTFFDYLRADLIKKTKLLIEEKEYQKALELVKTSGLKGDEVTLILIECDLAMSCNLCKDAKYAEACTYLSDALSRCGDTIYSTASCSGTAKLYYEFAKRFMPDFDKKADRKQAVPEFDKYLDLYIYLKLTDLIDSSQIVKAINLASLTEISDKILSAHIAARLDMANGHYNEAVSKLETIISSEEKQPTVHGSLLLFRVYDDLEQCAKSEGDYVSAYQYKEKKLKLYERASGVKL